MKLIEKIITKGHQDLTYREIYLIKHTTTVGVSTEFGLVAQPKVTSYKFKIEVKSDSYREQCYARGYVFEPNTLQWNLIYSIPSGAMETKNQLSYFPNAGVNPMQYEIEFVKDIITIRDKMKEIIF